MLRIGGLVIKALERLVEEQEPAELPSELFDPLIYDKKVINKLRYDITHNSPLPKIYSRFADLLITHPTQPIPLTEKITVTKQELYLISLSIDVNDDEVYVKLADTLENMTDEIELKDGRVLRKLDLYLEAIEHNPSNPRPYLHLGFSLKTQDEVVKTKDGTEFTKFELLYKVVELDPKNWKVYYEIAHLIPSNQTSIQLKSGKKLVKRKYLLKSVNLYVFFTFF